MIVLNRADQPGAGFMCDTNVVTILTADGSKTQYPMKSKRLVAKDIVDKLK